MKKQNKMEFTKEDLREGETVLIGKSSNYKYLYLGGCGLVHFISIGDNYTVAKSRSFTIEDLNKYFTIQKEEDLTVPLKKKVYDFVDVEVSNNGVDWLNCKLIAVTPECQYPYKIIQEDGLTDSYKYAKFKKDEKDK